MLSGTALSQGRMLSRTVLTVESSSALSGTAFSQGRMLSGGSVALSGDILAIQDNLESSSALSGTALSQAQRSPGQPLVKEECCPGQC